MNRLTSSFSHVPNEPHGNGDHRHLHTVPAPAFATDLVTTLPSMRRLLQAAPGALRQVRHPADGLMRLLIRGVSRHRTLAGPFRGNRFRWPAYNDTACTLGTYERELHHLIERLVAAGFDTVVDVGASVGIYVVGLGRLLPRARLIAFEAHLSSLRAMTRNVAANGLSNRTQVFGFCAPPALAAALDGAGQVLLIIDVEGYELELLDPATVPGLRSATVLVETHDFAVPGGKATLLARFAGTHNVDEYPTEPRTLADFPIPWVAVVPFGPVRRAAMRAMHEGRPARQSWLLLTPRNG